MGIVTRKGENAEFYGSMDEVEKQLDGGRHKPYELVFLAVLYDSCRFSV